jgi:drug/metabolite transporter (DMT)-like permease
MSDKTLFWIPALIWATTWHALVYQVGIVPITQSIAYRFWLAGLLFFLYALFKRESVRVPLRWHGTLFLIGVLQFGLNYLCTYEASKVITSGLLAVLFSLMVFSNAIAGRWLFSQTLPAGFVWAGVLGVLGVVLIFWPDLAHTTMGPLAWRGVLLGLVAVVFATLGNVVTLRATSPKSGAGVALVPVLAWSMVYGAFALSLAAGFNGQPLQFDFRPGYILSLLYLGFIGSFVAFLFYFKLAQRKGPGKAGMIAMIIPVVALAVSATLEGWRPTVISGSGIFCCLVGLWWANRHAPVPVSP